MESRKRTRKDMSITEKLHLLDRYVKLPKLTKKDAADRLGVSRGLLQNVLRDQEELRQAKTSGKGDRQRNRHGKNKDVEDALFKWHEFASSRNAPLDGPTLFAKAEELARQLGHEDFKPTDGWFGRWKKRNGIRHSTKLRMGNPVSGKLTQAEVEEVMAKIVREQKAENEVQGNEEAVAKIAPEQKAENEVQGNDEDDDQEPEPTPTNAEMRAMLRRLEVGLERRGHHKTCTVEN
ncbi:hypothetical protein BSKO_00318 [Bryopsis sp. KO-2023]|nr:hypothetical protein BSKO_00318 [Bryopsis sp. KO-2023]